MAEPGHTPDYDLADAMELTTAAQVQAVGHELRTTILGLLHERAATVTELARALDRPKSTVAYHVGVLAGTGLVRVTGTRRVRAIEERYYGRTARMFHVGVGPGRGDPAALPLDFNDLDMAGRESQAAYQAHRLWSFIRHARIPRERAGEFWERGMALVHEFDQLPRSGRTTYGFVVGLYPIPGYPALPDREGGAPMPADGRSRRRSKRPAR
jgi:DNA-binding transcriptional ArsR family regulator